MSKRSIFLSIGTAFFVLGAAGIAMVQTDLFERFTAREKPGLSQPAPEGGPGGAGGPGQPESSKKTPSPAPGEQKLPGTSAPEAVKPQAPPVAQAPAQQPSPKVQREPEAGQAPRPIPVPKVGKGERRYPGGQDYSEPPRGSIPKGPGMAPSEMPPPQSRGKIASGGREGSRVLSQKKTPPPAAAKSEPLQGRERGKGAPGRTGGHETLARGRTPAGSRQPVAIKFRFDPSRTSTVRLARVRLGDQVQVRVRRLGQTGGQLYLGLDLPDSAERRFDMYKAPAPAVITPIHDRDQLLLRADQFNKQLALGLDSKEGAILKLLEKEPGGRASRGKAAVRSKGYYEVEVVILTGNRFQIPPRSFI